LAVCVPIPHAVVWLRRIEPTAKTPLVPSLAVLALVVVGTVASRSMISASMAAQRWAAAVLLPRRLRAGGDGAHDSAPTTSAACRAQMDRAIHASHHLQGERSSGH
jgi:hypothetical protein